MDGLPLKNTMTSSRSCIKLFSCVLCVNLMFLMMEKILKDDYKSSNTLFESSEVIVVANFISKISNIN